MFRCPILRARWLALPGRRGDHASGAQNFSQQLNSTSFVTTLLKTPPSSAALLFVIVAASKSTFGAVGLTQSDGDLPAHIVVGAHILTSGALPSFSLASYTAPADPFVAHAWLSEVLFALLYRFGGLPLLAVFTALVIALTHAFVVVFLRQRGVDPRWALGAGIVSLALGSSHWLARPHMFSILGAILLLFVLESQPRRRLLLVAGLFVLWANLHGGWLFGLVLVGCFAFGDLIEYWITADPAMRTRTRNHALVLLVAFGATLLNPYGPGLHAEVLTAATSPLLAANIGEYMPPNFHRLAALPFLLAIVATLAILALSPRRMRIAWLTVLIVTSFFALRSVRVIPLFAVTAWPLIAVHAAQSWGGRGWNPRLFRDFARIDRQACWGPWPALMAVMLLALGLNRGQVGATTLIGDQFHPGRFPVDAVEAARSAGLTGRVFHPWPWGGYMMKNWPEARLHVDPLKFNATTIDSYTRIEAARPGWQRELDRWSADAVVVRTGAVLAEALTTEADWRRWYSDSTAVVFIRADHATNPTTRGYETEPEPEP
jgi:hypothetical protein